MRPLMLYVAGNAPLEGVSADGVVSLELLLNPAPVCFSDLAPAQPCRSFRLATSLSQRQPRVGAASLFVYIVNKTSLESLLHGIVVLRVRFGAGKLPMPLSQRHIAAPKNPTKALASAGCT